MIKHLLGSKKLTNIQIGILIALVAVWFSWLIAPSLNQPKVAKIYYQTQETMPTIKVDNRAKVLRKYLAKHNAPLTDSAEDFVAAADANGVDWRLVASISGVESTFGKHIPGGYNGWGWGVYGENRIYFTSWKDAIDTITVALKKDYIDKGYKDPMAMNRKYAASQTWGQKVTFFMNDIQRFADQNQVSEVVVVAKPELKTVTAGTSANLSSQTSFVASAR